MRIELEDAKKKEETGKFIELVEKGNDRQETKKTFSEMPIKGKIAYIWDYYKWWFIGTIIFVIVAVSFTRSYIENSKPVYIDVEMLNTFFGSDKTNTLEEDFIREAGVDLEEYNINFGFDIYMSTENYDTTMLAYQQRLMANYAAAQLDVVMGPVGIMEGPANCDGYGDLSRILPQDLIDELTDREYEFYYFDPSKDQLEDYEGEDIEPYFAGVYLDNCSYLNNMGEFGAYPVATKEEDRVIFTIPANSEHTDHSIEFLRFLIHNR